MGRPVRKAMGHTPPLGVDASGAFYFVTVCAAERGGTPFVAKADAILDAARHYQRTGKWFLSLFMVMPDHIHMLVHVPVGGDLRAPRNHATTNDALVNRLRAAEDIRPYRGMAKTIGDFKSYLTKFYGLAFQRDFFDTRIRDDAHYAEEWDYIVRNPVARGLVAVPREWPHVMAFDRATGAQRSARPTAPQNKIAKFHSPPTFSTYFLSDPYPKKFSFTPLSPEWVM